MDDELESRRLSNQPPFNGTTVYLSDYVPLSVLRDLLAPVVAILHARFPSSDLLKVHDWHEHDGIISPPKPSSWSDVQALLASDEAMIVGACIGDTYVRALYYPTGCGFVLRVYVPEIYDNPYYSHDDPELVHLGLFDVTSSAAIAKEIVEAISQVQMPVVAVESQPAKQFFDQRYAG